MLLAKDLLRLQTDPSFDLRAWLRPVVFIPESKRLNVLLREFRVSRNHMAIVVDEFGGVAGLVTIEDVLEQIVGDIEDEYDFDETEDNIRLDKSGRYRVKARTEVADFNAAFGCSLSEEDADTIGGLILSQLGRVPKRNESIDLGGLRLRAARGQSPPLHPAGRTAAARRSARTSVKLSAASLLLHWRRWCLALPLSPPLRRLPGIRWPGWPQAGLTSCYSGQPRRGPA